MEVHSCVTGANRGGDEQQTCGGPRGRPPSHGRRVDPSNPRAEPRTRGATSSTFTPEATRRRHSLGRGRLRYPRAKGGQDQRLASKCAGTAGTIRTCGGHSAWICFERQRRMGAATQPTEACAPSLAGHGIEQTFDYAPACRFGHALRRAEPVRMQGTAGRDAVRCDNDERHEAARAIGERRRYPVIVHVGTALRPATCRRDWAPRVA